MERRKRRNAKVHHFFVVNQVTLFIARIAHLWILQKNKLP